MAVAEGTMDGWARAGLTEKGLVAGSPLGAALDHPKSSFHPFHSILYYRLFDSIQIILPQAPAPFLLLFVSSFSLSVSLAPLACGFSFFSSFGFRFIVRAVSPRTFFSLAGCQDLQCFLLLPLLLLLFHLFVVLSFFLSF